ncbi:MAG: hypothetical protein K5882_04410 [Bacteroidales bacterium]|nr:hypothetical protein [Bacteroidales bacterium]
MKKYTLTFMIFTTILVASGQTQDPSEIDWKWNEIQHLCEKYDEGADSAYRILNEQLAATKRDPVANAIWHSCLGQFLSDYCDGSRFLLRDRTEVAGETPADFKEWDIRTFKRRAREEYLLSLKNAKALQAVDAKSYSLLLQKMEKQLQVKTLFEVLAYRAIEHLVSDLDNEAPDRSLPVSDLWDNDRFLKMPLTITDASSTLQNVLSVYQGLTRHHLARNQEKDFIMLTIERYDFMRGQGLAPDNSLDWYIPFLEKWAKECEQMEGYGLIAYKIGCLYLERNNNQSGFEGKNIENPYHDDLIKAESWLKVALNSSGKSFYKESVSRTVKELHERTIAVSALSGENSISPTGSATLWRFAYTNCKQLHVKVVKATSASKGMINDEAMMYVISEKPVYEDVVELPDNQDLMRHSGLYLLPELPAGAYWLLVSDKPSSQWDKSTPRECTLFQISDIEILPRNTEYGLEVLALHRQTGEPLFNAKVTMHKDKQTITRTTDRDGFCQFGRLRKDEYGRSNGFTVSWQGQTLSHGGFRWWQHDRAKQGDQIYAHLFTDRSLYRPTQTVHFKGIFEFVNRNKDSRLLADTLVKVILKDVNFQQVEEIELRTNEFGSIAGEFTLPEGGLTGTYYIYAYVDDHSFSHSISVEEYKLPAFEVEIETPEETFSIGQEVTVKGSAMALAGYPLDHASVSYRVTRNASFPWWRSYWWCPTYEPRTVAYGTLETDDDGNFRITFSTEEDMTLRRYTPLYRYEVRVDVTDINGETHSGRTVVYVSSRNLLLSCYIPGEIAVGKNDNQYKISLTNTAGKPQSGTVGYEIFRLQTPDIYMYELDAKADIVITDTNQIHQNFPWLAFHEENQQQNWPAASLKKGTVNVSKDTAAYFAFPDFNNLSDGYYKVVFNTEDANGNRIESENYVHIFREESTRCSAYRQLWTSIDNSVNVGETLTVTIGSVLPEAHVLFEIYSHNEKMCAEWVTLHGNTHAITYPVTAADLGGICIHLLCLNHNQIEDESYTVSVTDEQKDIRFEFLRFRDKTVPGSQEEYQVRLTDKNGKPVSAELLCSMYDMALDALGSSNYHSISFFSPWNGARGYFEKLSWGRSFSQYNNRNIYLYYSPELIKNWLEFFPNACTRYYGFGKMMSVRGNRSDGAQTIVDGVRVQSNGSFDAEFYEEEAVVELSMVADEAVAEPMAAKATGSGAGEPAEQVRTNFAETAFFYPQLRTDERGDVFISFTMPDALTKWKMQGVAHNPDFQYGRFEKFVQTAKDVMIVPNAPRFLREGDTMDFSAKVVNMSGRNICGYVTLQMFNAVNNQPIAMICDDGSDNGGGRDAKFCVSTMTGSQQYEVPAGTSSEIRFRIVVPEDVPAITYRIIAHNTDPKDVAGDGEEKTLPVLTNRMMVTETMPFYISGKGEKTFTFNKLRDAFGATANKTLKHYRLTVECTPNPVWYAIQAMPYMMEYPHECNEQRFSRYYANALATHILKANPVIEEVFNRWQVESPDAFCSALEKNQELKQVVLEETPWVLDAQREGANKQALAAMFDFKRMAKEEAATLRKLQQAQNGDGGWPWFSGGKSCDFITRHIVAGFGHLNALGVSTEVSGSTLHNAVSYMDEQMYQRYLDRKKYHYTYVDETHYLYARSFYKDKVSAKHKAAYDTCYKVLLSDWKSESYYTQAMIALTAWRNGDQKVAKEIVAYLKSMAQHNEEMGMFWKKQGGGWFWYEQPVERQAMLIEAFHTITPEDEESLAQMQLWLLKQKQTQHWSTTKSTTEAVYALLLNKTLVADDKTVAVTVGNVRLPDETVQTEAGTGYFKKAWTGEEITADKANVRIEKGTDGPAWGGLYWQYFENLDKITRSDDKNLIIEKKLFKVENTDKGEVLKAITTNQPLQKGDKVRVRVVITADRDMEFVHLKDMRAATFEPVNVFSQYKYQNGLWYYESTKDAATHFFIDWMPKGKYVFEYTLFATQSGDFSNGITHIECMYAPEFQSHSAGVRVKVR